MKINQHDYVIMFHAVKAVVENAGGPQPIKDRYADKTVRRMLWDVWHAADNNLRYDDTHPGFAKGLWPRVHPQYPGFDLYANGLNDSHIETALHKIGKELGLV